MSKFETYYSDIKNLLLESDEKLSSVDQLPAEDQEFLENYDKYDKWKNLDQKECYEKFEKILKITNKLAIKELEPFKFPRGIYSGMLKIENGADFFENVSDTESKKIVQNVLQVWYDKKFRNASSDKKEDFVKQNFYTIIHDDTIKQEPSGDNTVKQKTQQDADKSAEDKNQESSSQRSEEKSQEKPQEKNAGTERRTVKIKPPVSSQTPVEQQVQQQTNTNTERLRTGKTKTKLPVGTTAELVSLLAVFANDEEKFEKFKQTFMIDGVDETLLDKLFDKMVEIGV